MNLWLVILCSLLFSLHASLEQKLISLDQNLSKLKTSLPRLLPERPLTRIEELRRDLELEKEKRLKALIEERKAYPSDLEKVFQSKIEGTEKILKTPEIESELVKLSNEMAEISAEIKNIKKLSTRELADIMSDIGVNHEAFIKLLITYDDRSDKNSAKETEFLMTWGTIKTTIQSIEKQYNDRLAEAKAKEDPLQRLKELLSQLQKDLKNIQGATQLLSKYQQQQIQGRLGNYIAEKLKMQTNIAKVSYNDNNIVVSITQALEENQRKFTKTEQPITAAGKEKIANDLKNLRKIIQDKREELIEKSKITAEDNINFAKLVEDYENLVNAYVRNINPNFKDNNLQPFKNFITDLNKRLLKQRRSALGED